MAAKDVQRARRRLDRAVIDEVFEEYGPLPYLEFMQRLYHKVFEEPPFPCLGTKTETLDGTDYDCEYEYAGEITCDECQVNGGAFDPRESRDGDG